MVDLSSGINVEENLNRLDEFHISVHLHLKPACVLTPHGTLYAHCYILYLLGGILLLDKANNTVHIRYLPLLANYDAISTYSWGSAVLCWLYRAMCLATDYNTKGMVGYYTLLMSWIYYTLPFWAPEMTSPYNFPLATRWAGKKGKNDYVEQRLLKHRLKLDNLKVDEFMWMSYMDARIMSRVLGGISRCPTWRFLYSGRAFDIILTESCVSSGEKQGLPNPPLNIDTFMDNRLATTMDGAPSAYKHGSKCGQTDILYHTGYRLIEQIHCARVMIIIGGTVRGELQANLHFYLTGHGIGAWYVFRCS
ncbi:hypothetical protein Ahy_A09g042947 [Arachis hypogaea]|uniref:Aminotransferase-like plant mobile domain-containing protein n=1 Tax=Arachis hypogaea TaxID=3818 RepID=A0A445BH57_ARAHY|nr:hypothetical protein Ahy_A09g042947 [Arachis hypogaea]